MSENNFSKRCGRDNQQINMNAEWHGTADAPLPDPHARMPGFPDTRSAPVPTGEELLHLEDNMETQAPYVINTTRYPLNGTTFSYLPEVHGAVKLSDVPAPTPPIASYPVVVLPAAEAEILRRIAEVATEYNRLRLWETRKELFRLAEDWRKTWGRT